jgi:hypothetical protein
MKRSQYDFNKITSKVYGKRKQVEGEIIALLHVSFEKRGLELIETKSRAVRLNEIHELMLTDEQSAKPGGRADRVRAFAFFEITKPGIIVVGDNVFIDKRLVGSITGYDLTHMPNHMNIVLKTKTLEEPKVEVGASIVFKLD